MRILGYLPLPQTGAATSNYNYQSPSNQDTHRYDLDTNSLQVEQLLETAGVIASGDRPAGGEFAI